MGLASEAAGAAEVQRVLDTGADFFCLLISVDADRTNWQSRTRSIRVSAKTVAAIVDLLDGGLNE